MLPKVIIGSGFGDEGKGAVTNFFSTPNSTIIRFNGGSQAGHTVVHNGFRHVFSHIGSGTLKGAKTHLSKYFVCNPLGFMTEYQHLIDNGYQPQISVDPNSYITTPYDIFINQEIERKRGGDRHGSVGVGFGETIERSERGYNLQIKDLFLDIDDLYHILYCILDYWVPDRCKELGISLSYQDSLSEYISRFIYDLYDSFFNKISIVDDEKILKEENIIFEGAQGLLLDEEYGTMPYCTRSSCGLQNIEQLLGNRKFDVYYISRPYTTRHGAGPLLFECEKPRFVIDKTNEPNEFQGSLRYSPLNLDKLKWATELDSQRYGSNINNKIGIITCMDQVLFEDKINIIKDNKIKSIETLHLDKYIEEIFPQYIMMSNMDYSNV